MVIPSTPERVENSVPSQIKYVSVLEQGNFAMINPPRFLNRQASAPTVMQATRNQTPVTPLPSAPAVSTNSTRQMAHGVMAHANNDLEDKTPISMLHYFFCKDRSVVSNMSPELKASINPETLEVRSTDPSTASSTQANAGSSTAEMDTMSGGGSADEQPVLPVLQTAGEVETFTSKSERIYNNVKSIASETEHWLDPISLDPISLDPKSVSTDNHQDYATEILIKLKRVDPQVIEPQVVEVDPQVVEVDPQVVESPSFQPTGDIGADSSSQQTSLTPDSRTKSDIQKVVDQLDDEQKSEVLTGLAQTVAHKVNKANLKSAIEKNPAIFNSAIQYSVDNLIEKGLVDANDLKLDLTHSEILTEIFKHCRKLEAADELNATKEQKQLGLEINYTGDKNKNQYNVFGNTIDYNQTKTGITSSARAIQKINSEIANSPNSHTQQKGVSSEEIIQKFSGKTQQDTLQVLSKLETSIQDVKENPIKVLEYAEKVIEIRKPLESLTFETEYEADHAIRKNTRIGLGQRMASTDSSGDSGECVIVPRALHKIKESDGKDFVEPLNAQYKDGIHSLLGVLEQNVNKNLDKCSPEDRMHIPVEKYKAAYKTAFDNKKQELRIKFPGCSSQDIYMIFHARLAQLANYTALDSAYTKCVPNQVVFATQTIPENDNQILLKDHPLNEKVIKVQEETVKSLCVGVRKNTYFINSLHELVSPAAVPFIEVVQQQNQSHLVIFVSELKSSLSEFSDSQLESFRKPQTLFKSLGSQKLTRLDPKTDEGKAEMLYHYSKNVLQLTTSGNRLNPRDNVLPLKQLFGGKIPIENLLEITTTKTTAVQESSIRDKANLFNGFDSKSDYDLFKLLTGKDNLLKEGDLKMSEDTARVIIMGKDFKNLKEIKTYAESILEEKTSSDIKGVGDGKIGQLYNVVNTALRRQDEARAITGSPSSSRPLTASRNARGRGVLVASRSPSQTSSPGASNLLAASPTPSQTSSPSSSNPTNPAPLPIEDQ